MSRNIFFEAEVLTPLRGVGFRSARTGGLRFATTSGYFRSTLRVENASLVNVSRSITALSDLQSVLASANLG